MRLGSSRNGLALDALCGHFLRYSGGMDVLAWTLSPIHDEQAEQIAMKFLGSLSMHLPNRLNK